MNRKWTNRIRFFMDECIPPLIKDGNGSCILSIILRIVEKNIATAMDFKKHYFEWSPEQLQLFYSNINSISTNLKTDISENGLKYILSQVC